VDIGTELVLSHDVVGNEAQWNAKVLRAGKWGTQKTFSAPIFTPPKFCGRTTYTTRRIFTPFCFLAPLYN
jgi:hypothetical protein